LNAEPHSAPIAASGAWTTSHTSSEAYSSQFSSENAYGLALWRPKLPQGFDINDREIVILRDTQAPSKLDPQGSDEVALVDTNHDHHHDVTLKDVWLDQWLTATGENLKKLVSSFVKGFNSPTFRQTRKRARQKQAQVIYDRTIEVVIINLARLVVMGGTERPLVVSLDTGKKRTRYDNPDLTPKSLRVVFQCLEGLAAVVEVGCRGGMNTTLMPNQWFKNRVKEAGVTISEFGRSPDEELIILSRTDKRGCIADGKYKTRKKRVWLDYRDTPVTVAYRSQVRRINEFLTASDIVFLDDRLEPAVDDRDRALRRRFKDDAVASEGPSFQAMGRLFGGFWMNLAKARRGNIRIDGEPIVVLDYSNMVPRLAYAHVAHEPPLGDLYDLSGLLHGYDRNEHRGGMKQALNALLNGGMRLSNEIMGKLPQGATSSQVKDALLVKHPVLAPLFGSTIGLRLMFDESRVLLEVLEKLMSLDIVALV
jgi:hypothetical protein